MNKKRVIVRLSSGLSASVPVSELLDKHSMVVPAKKSFSSTGEKAVLTLAHSQELNQLVFKMRDQWAEYQRKFYGHRIGDDHTEVWKSRDKYMNTQRKYTRMLNRLCGIRRAFTPPDPKLRKDIQPYADSSTSD